MIQEAAMEIHPKMRFSATHACRKKAESSLVGAQGKANQGWLKTGSGTHAIGQGVHRMCTEG
jgi:hypothetical protein